VAANECYNSVAPSNDPAFNMLPGSAVRLKALTSNAGTSSIDAYTVSWSVRGPGGTTVYSDEVVSGPLAPDAIEIVESDTTFAPSALGEYLVTCRAIATGDANTENDTTYLRFFVGDMPRWFRYDDNGTPESHSNFSAGNGWAVAFTPVSYTAAIESVRVEVNVTGTGNGDFRIYRNDAQGFPGGTHLWRYTGAVVTGWNALPVSPAVQIYEGQSFTLAYLWSGQALGKDDTPPNAGSISNMGTVSWQASSDGAVWDADNSGNWAMQVYLAPGLAPPEIATSPDTVNFGEVDTTGATTVTRDLMIYNVSTGSDLSVTQMVINPPLIRSAFSFAPATLNIAPGDSDVVQISFNPSSVRNYSGVITVTNNSLNAPAKNVPIRGDGVIPGAAELPESGLPTAFVLTQNYPNPFNPSTEIRFGLPVAANVRLAVFNVLGQEVALLASGVLPAGVHSRTFDAAVLPAGIYFYRLEAGAFSDIRKMILLR